MPFSSLGWINSTNITAIYAVSANGAGYTKFTPGSTFGPQAFTPTSDGTLPGYVVVTKQAIAVNASLFVGDVVAPTSNSYAKPGYMKPGYAKGTDAAVTITPNSYAQPGYMQAGYAQK